MWIQRGVDTLSFCTGMVWCCTGKERSTRQVLTSEESLKKNMLIFYLLVVHPVDTNLSIIVAFLNTQV